MSDPTRPDNLGELLTAFADGELDPARARAVLDHLSAHPEALEQLRDQQRLRVAADRVVRRHTPAVPDELRRRISAMALDGAAERGAATLPNLSRRTRWWIPLTAAACIAAGVLADRTLLLRLHPPSTASHPAGSAEAPPVGGIPADVVSHASRVHSDCARLAAGVHAARFPQALAPLAVALRTELGGPNPHPDLTGIGFAFAGVGPCDAPLKGTVHLLYRSTGPGATRAISVFVQPHKGQYDLRTGTLYTLSGPSSPFPVFAWRTERVVHILVADTEKLAAAARQGIPAVPRS